MSIELLTLLGSIISILLAVNGYFFKELVQSTNDIKLKLSILITKHDNTEDLTKRNAANLTNLNERLHSLEARLLKLEAYNKNTK
jgi:exosome complex RNA-binding protein Rrp4